MFEDNLLRHFCESSFEVKAICWFGPRMDTHTQSISNLEKWFKEMFFISITEFEFHFVNLHYTVMIRNSLIKLRGFMLKKKNFVTLKLLSAANTPSRKMKLLCGVNNDCFNA